MWDNIDKDKHYTGSFNILGEEISGELIYNKKNGVILLNLVKTIDAPSLFGKSYGDIEIITGKLNSGTIVTLFNNRCSKNHTQAFQSQQLNYVAEYMIWSKKVCSSKKYNKMYCVLENALRWSGLSMLDTSDHETIKLKYNKSDTIYNWFDCKITFSTSLNCGLFSYPIQEETKVTERLVLEIESTQKYDISYFISIRDKIMALISFAIGDNINISEQYLNDYDDSYLLGKDKDIVEYYKHYIITSEHHLPTQKKLIRDYNFTLKQISPEKDIKKELSLLEPIFNLYLSLFKYSDMPIEMIFLNIVQALETFHARFFYDDKKEKYVESVIERFGGCANFDLIEKLLLCDTQKDDNCHYIILVSRLNDLLIGKYDGLFYEYYGINPDFAQNIADTRHYYTHYGKSKEKKALKGNDLLEAIFILTTLLEYNVCLVLGIDIRQSVTQRLTFFESRKQFNSEFKKN